MSEREYTTSAVAASLGIRLDLIRKWKARGLLKLAPAGVAGQGRSVECMWSPVAVEEVRRLAVTKRERQAEGGRHSLANRRAARPGGESKNGLGSE